jgi:hypothetical protein
MLLAVGGVKGRRWRLDDKTHNAVILSDEEGVKQRKFWESHDDAEDYPFQEDQGVNTNIFADNSPIYTHGKDWVKYIDAPPYGGVNIPRAGPGRLFWINVRFFIQVRATGTGAGARTITKSFWVRQPGKFEGGVWNVVTRRVRGDIEVSGDNGDTGVQY